MAEINTWQYGDSGKTVKEIIDTNFDNLNTQVNQLTNRWEREFKTADWEYGVIRIPYSEYKKINPCVDLYIKTDNGFSFVYGGCVIKEDGIELQSDMPYEGKVVVR